MSGKVSYSIPYDNSHHITEADVVHSRLFAQSEQFRKAKLPSCAGETVKQW